MLTDKSLCSILVRAGVPPRRASSRAPYIAAALEVAEINTDLRVAAFLGQVSHESMSWRYAEEIWGPTRTQLRYERNFAQPWPMTPAQAQHRDLAVNRLAYTLGNVRPGDGSRYRGRGDIQVTGRTNHRAATKRLRTLLGESVPDFEAAPGVLSTLPWSSMSAADYWRTKGLNQWSDTQDDRELTRRINGGYNGLGDRIARRLLFLSLIRTESS